MLLQGKQRVILTGFAHEGNFTQAFLHHPLEVTTQEAVDEEDVESPLVVGDKDIGGMFVQLLTSHHTDGNQQEVTCQLRPYLAGVVAPNMCSAQQRTYDGDQRRQDGQHQK